MESGWTAGGHRPRRVGSWLRPALYAARAHLAAHPDHRPHHPQQRTVPCDDDTRLSHDQAADRSRITTACTQARRLLKEVSGKFHGWRTWRNFRGTAVADREPQAVLGITIRCDVGGAL